MTVRHEQFGDIAVIHYDDGYAVLTSRRTNSETLLDDTLSAVTSLNAEGYGPTPQTVSLQDGTETYSMIVWRKGGVTTTHLADVISLADYRSKREAQK